MRPAAKDDGQTRGGGAGGILTYISKCYTNPSLN